MQIHIIMLKNHLSMDMLPKMIVVILYLNAFMQVVFQLTVPQATLSEIHLNGGTLKGEI